MPKTVFITGASSGIGKATALYFHKQGWNVVATMRNPQDGKKLAKLNNVICPALDVTKVSSINQAIHLAKEKFKSIDVLVNNAGFAVMGAFETATAQQCRAQFDINVLGLMNVTRALLPILRKQNGAVIINISSIGGRVTFPIYSLYHATKWAVEGFSESLQFELEQFNVKVKLVEPGPVRTDFYGRSMQLAQSPYLPEYTNVSNTLMNKFDKIGSKGVLPVEVAKVIFIAANDNKWKLRYPVGNQTAFMLLLRKILPFSLFQNLVKIYLKYAYNKEIK